MQLRKYQNYANETLSDFNETDEIANHINQVISFYNNALPYIESLPSFHIGYFFATHKLIELALNHTFFNNKTLLEIGCGLGKTLFYLANTYNVNCTGIDLNAKQIEILSNSIYSQKLTDRITALVLNALNINSNLGSYDIVWSEDSFSHIPNRNVLFKNIYNILKKNGVLIFSDLVKTRRISYKELLSQQKAWSLWNIESKESYLKIINDSGFKILECLDNIGNTLLKEHIKEDSANGDIDYKGYKEYLINNREKLLKEWGIYNYTRRFERLKTYEYFEEEKLDYNFYVALKK